MNLSETINLLNTKTSNLVKQKVATQQDPGKKVAAEGDEPETSTVTDTDEVSEQFDTFLTLLTSQIKNQDPLAPLDSTQFVEQLATFSGLELQATGNQSLERITNLLAQQIALTSPGQPTASNGTTKV